MTSHKHPTAYQCKHCKTTETIPYNQDGIKPEQTDVVYCPKCLAKGKRRKMVQTETTPYEKGKAALSRLRRRLK